MSRIEQLVAERVHSWAMSEFGKKEEKLIDWPVITISRQYGARGRSLARKLGELIGFDVWDKTLLSAIAQEAGAEEKFLSSLDERRRSMIDDILIGTFMGSKHSNTHYFRSLIRVMKTIGIHGKSIIVGRGANYIIKDPNVLRVRLICSDNKRAPRIAANEGLSERDAIRVMHARDEERADFAEHYFKRDIDDPEDYDMVLNSGCFDVDQLAEIVLHAYEQKVGRAVPRIA